MPGFSTKGSPKPLWGTMTKAGSVLGGKATGWLCSVPGVGGQGKMNRLNPQTTLSLYFPHVAYNSQGARMKVIQAGLTTRMAWVVWGRKGSSTQTPLTVGTAGEFALFTNRDLPIHAG